MNPPDSPDTLKRGSLVAVGTGINGIGQISLEALECIRNAEQLFYCVVDPIAELWIRQQNASAHSLSDFYAVGKRRSDTYRQMTQTIVSAVTAGSRVCVAFYGHPGVLVQSTHDAIRRLRKAGYRARMLPGISAEGCLYADLGINPGSVGMQSFEATDFLRQRRKFDPTSGLLLWQVGVLGNVDSRLGVCCDAKRLATLSVALRKHYEDNHRLVLYYAATFPADPPHLQHVRLKDLHRTEVLPMAILYVPPRAQRLPDRRIVRWSRETSPSRPKRA